MEGLVNIETITNWLENQVAQKLPISPGQWVEAAQKINVLLGDEHDKLFDLQQKVSQEKVDYLESGKSVAEAKTRVEASEIYKEFQIQRAKIERIQEFIRLAKVQSRLKDEEYRGGNFSH